MEIAPLFLASAVGFSHAFEADHLVAVSNIVTRRNNVFLALKDGIYWGLGHTSTVLLVGSFFIFGKFALNENGFRYFEVVVGITLMILGFYRLYKLYKPPVLIITHTHNHHIHQHKLAYSVGLLHGLAGSGALVLTVLTTIEGTLGGILYLIIFGIGSIAGMMLAAGVFSIPFSGKIINNQIFRISLIIFSSLLCVGLGVIMVYQNLK